VPHTATGMAEPPPPPPVLRTTSTWDRWGRTAQSETTDDRDTTNGPARLPRGLQVLSCSNCVFVCCFAAPPGSHALLQLTLVCSDESVAWLMIGVVAAAAEITQLWAGYRPPGPNTD
jgi:hypothetical protein